MGQTANEVVISVYRISQDTESKRISFWVYNDVMEEEEMKHLLTHDELYKLLCEKVQYFHKGGYIT